MERFMPKWLAEQLAVVLKWPLLPEIGQEAFVEGTRAVVVRRKVGASLRYFVCADTDEEAAAAFTLARRASHVRVIRIGSGSHDVIVMLPASVRDVIEASYFAGEGMRRGMQIMLQGMGADLTTEVRHNGSCIVLAPRVSGP